MKNTVAVMLTAVLVGCDIMDRPDIEEISALYAESAWGALGGVNGRFFGSGANTIFLPGGYYRLYEDGRLVSDWHSYYIANGVQMWFSSTETAVSIWGRSVGALIRCVKN